MEINLRPLRETEINFRIGEISGNRMELVPYISPRTVMNIFDDSLTPMGWARSLGPYENNTVRCTISVYDQETKEWVEKGDYGRGEDAKTASSDALKRAAVVWGVGRALYFNLNECDGIWIDNFMNKVNWRIYKSRVYCDDEFVVTQLGYDENSGELCALVITDTVTKNVVYQMDYRNQKQFKPNPKRANISASTANTSTSATESTQKKAVELGAKVKQLNQAKSTDNKVTPMLKHDSNPISNNKVESSEPKQTKTVIADKEPVVLSSEEQAGQNSANSESVEKNSYIDENTAIKEKYEGQETLTEEIDPNEVKVDVGTSLTRKGMTVGQLNPANVRWVYQNTKSEIVKKACLIMARTNSAVRTCFIDAGIPA